MVGELAANEVKKGGCRGTMHLKLYVFSMNTFNNQRKAETYRDRVSMLRWERRGQRVRTRSKRRHHSKRRKSQHEEEQKKSQIDKGASI